MPRCATCREEKDASEFNWRWKALGIIQPSCRDCQKGHRKTWYEGHKEEHLENVYERKQRVIQESREYVWNYLASNPCSQCGERDPRLLEFHHTGKKKKTVSEMAGQGYSIGAIQKEIDKCVVLCVSCHRKLTYDERGWYQK